MYQRPRFIQASLPFEGRGLTSPFTLGPDSSYRVAGGMRAQLIYFRAGNSLDELVCLSLTRDGAVIRHFPIGAKASVHVPLAVIEELEPGSLLEVTLAAPDGARGHVIFDIGLMEVD